MSRRIGWIGLVLCLVVAHSTPAQQPSATYPQRWNFLRIHLNSDEAEKRLSDLLRQMKESRCTHLYLEESRMSRLYDVKSDYHQRAQRVQALAKELGIEIVPGIFPIGYSGKLLHYNGNFMSGIPAREMPFVVSNGLATPDAAAVPVVPNGDLEKFDGHRFAGWGAQKTAGLSQFVDTAEQHSGHASLRIEIPQRRPDPKTPTHVTLTQPLKVKPFQWYYFTCWIKGPTKGLSFNTLKVVGKGNRNLTPMAINWPEGEGWRQFRVPFNTLENDQVTLLLSAHLPGAKVWIDDLAIEPAGLMLVVRRDWVPLVVTSEDGQTTYKEGVDFKPVADPVLNKKPFGGEVTINHEPARIELTENSAIKNGQKLKVSFYHTTRLGWDQDVISIQDPQVMALMDKTMSELVKVWPANGYLMNFDEIRLGGWEPNESGRNEPLGEVLGRNFRKAYDSLKRHAPHATAYTWSDMFTPYHNARPFSVKGYYWMCNGNYDGAWESLPRDVVIFNWYSPDDKTPRFFAERGHRQVLCGYYDRPDVTAMKQNIAKWMTVTKGVPNIDGFMYTTWKHKYEPMSEYFQLLDTWGQWDAGTPKSGAGAAEE